jgi:hypothetical protein
MLRGDLVDAVDNGSRVLERMSRIAVMGSVRQERPNPGASLVSASIAVPGDLLLGRPEFKLRGVRTVYQTEPSDLAVRPTETRPV